MYFKGKNFGGNVIFAVGENSPMILTGKDRNDLEQTNWM